MPLYPGGCWGQYLLDLSQAWSALQRIQVLAPPPLPTTTDSPVNHCSGRCCCGTPKKPAASKNNVTNGHCFEVVCYGSVFQQGVKADTDNASLTNGSGGAWFFFLGGGACFWIPLVKVLQFNISIWDHTDHPSIHHTDHPYPLVHCRVAGVQSLSRYLKNGQCGGNLAWLENRFTTCRLGLLPLSSWILWVM